MSLSVELPKLNEILKLGRERKRATLQMAHQDTRIAIAYLQALEAGEYDKFPAEVYCLGFLKKYAVYLGLDPEEMIALYKKEQDSHKEVQVVEEKKDLEVQKQEQSADLIKVLAFIIVLVFVGGWWLLTMVKAPKKMKTDDQYSEIRKKLDQTPTVEQSRSRTLNLTVYASESVWMRVVPDQKLAFEGFVAGGSSRTWEGDKEIFARIGNVESVSLILNGKPVDVRSGAVKSVKEILLTRESLEGAHMPAVP